MAAALKLVDTAQVALNPLSVEIPMKDIVPTLTQEIRMEHFVRRTPITKIAKAMKVGPSTVSKIMHGESKYPRMATVHMALLYFGYELVARRR